MAPGLRRGFSASSLSSSDEDLVDSILSQAMDQVALEQVAALNTAHLGDDSVLPDDLESRFRKLKSFPGAATPEPRARSLPPAGKGVAAARDPSPPGRVKAAAPREQAPDRPGSDRAASPTQSPPPPPQVAAHESVGDKDAAAVPTADSRSSNRRDLPPSPTRASPPARARSHDSSHSPRLHRRSPSPPRGCCFGLSPRSKQRSAARRLLLRGARTGPRDPNSMAGAAAAGGGWDSLDDDELLAELELGTLSIKEQGKRMKRALREQEKAAREAEKIVDWVRQASARLEFSAAAAGIHDETLSDEEKENRL